MGASLGAVASLTTAWRYPGIFGNLLLQSGSFVLDNTGPRRRDPLFDQVAAAMQANADTIYVNGSCGNDNWAGTSRHGVLEKG